MKNFKGTASTHFFGCPLETSDNTVLDLIEILYCFSGIHDKIWARALRSETPDFSGLVDVPFVCVGYLPASELGILFGIDVSLKVTSSHQAIFTPARKILKRNSRIDDTFQCS